MLELGRTEAFIGGPGAFVEGFLGLVSRGLSAIGVGFGDSECNKLGTTDL